jgi:hypothetical protein
MKMLVMSFACIAQRAKAANGTEVHHSPAVGQNRNTG